MSLHTLLSNLPPTTVEPVRQVIVFYGGWTGYTVRKTMPDVDYYHLWRELLSGDQPPIYHWFQEHGSRDGYSITAFMTPLRKQQVINHITELRKSYVSLSLLRPN